MEYFLCQKGEIMPFDNTMTVAKMIKKTAGEYPQGIAQYKRKKSGAFEKVTY